MIGLGLCYAVTIARASLQNLILESDAFGIVLLKALVRGDRIGKHLQMKGLARMASGIDVNPNGRHWSLLSFRFPQCVSLRYEPSVGSTFRFNARMTPIRAIMVGPLSSTTRSRALTAACHSSRSCSAWEASIVGGVLEGDELATAVQGNGIVERPLPTALSHGTTRFARSQPDRVPRGLPTPAQAAQPSRGAVLEVRSISGSRHIGGLHLRLLQGRRPNCGS